MKCKYCGVEIVEGYMDGIKVFYNKKRQRMIFYKISWLERKPHSCRFIEEIKGKKEFK